MQKFFTQAATLSVLCLAVAGSALAVDSPDLAALQGTWTTKKTNPEGVAYTQSIEFQKNKMTFKITAGDGAVRLMAKGDVKAEKLGPFNILKISDIEAGASASELQAINDDRISVYMLDDDKLVMASNFDKARNQQKPAADTYSREKSAK